MERINKIIHHPTWIESVGGILELEKERIFCGHDVQHFLDVARLAWIENLEKGLGLSKELIYAAALLHDIGRHLQYTENIPHEKGSAMLANEILEDCGFDAGEQKEVLSAILGHRTKETQQDDSLAGIIYRSDKKSRMCLFCDAEKECNWSMEKKNMELMV